MIAGMVAPDLRRETGGARPLSHVSKRTRALIAAVAASGLLLDFVGCGRPPEARKGPAALPAGRENGTRRMAERLDEISRGLDPRQNIFVNTARVALLKGTIAQKPAQAMDFLPTLADEMLKAGRTEEAIDVGESLLHPAPADAAAAPSPLHTHQFLGLAYMRLGEQENCV